MNKMSEDELTECILANAKILAYVHGIVCDEVRPSAQQDALLMLAATIVASHVYVLGEPLPAVLLRLTGNIQRGLDKLRRDAQ